MGVCACEAMSGLFCVGRLGAGVMNGAVRTRLLPLTPSPAPCTSIAVDLPLPPVFFAIAEGRAWLGLCACLC